MSYWDNVQAAPGWETFNNDWYTQQQALMAANATAGNPTVLSGPTGVENAPAAAAAPAQQIAVGAKPSAQQIAAFFESNKNNPAAIVQAANQYGLTAQEIAAAVGKPEEMQGYMQWAGITQGPNGLQIAGGGQGGAQPFAGAWKDFNFQEAMKQPGDPNNGGARLVNGYWVHGEGRPQTIEGQGENATMTWGDPTEYWVTKDLGKSTTGGWGGGGSAIYENAPYDRYDAQGNYLGSNNYTDMGTDGLTKATAWFVAIMGMYGVGAAVAGSIAQTAATQGISAADAAAALGYELPPAAAEVANQAGAVLSKAALDGTASFGANSVAGALDISALQAATTPAAAQVALTKIASDLGYTGLTSSALQQIGSKISAIPGAAEKLASASGLTQLLGGNLGNLLGPAVSLVGGAINANAADKAAEAQQKSVADSNALLKYMYDDTKAMNEPWRKAGTGGINRMADLMGVSGNTGASGYGDFARKFDMQTDYLEDPGYRFRLGEGTKALERQMAARGGLYSGKALKDTQDYVQGMASQEFGSAYDRWRTNQTDQFNRLASLSGSGQTATSQTGAAGQNYGNQAGQNIIGGGNAAAAGKVGTANAWGGALSQGVSMYQQNELMNRILGGRGM
jgi:hypothetical protein